jgi:hypothetical protein
MNQIDEKGIKAMTREVIKKDPRELDGFAGYEDATDDNERTSASVIQGAIVKFTNEAKWVARDGEELPPDLELVPVGVARVVQKWIDQEPVETVSLAAGQRFPDLDELNDQAPKDEWSEDFNGNPRGPWQKQSLVYLLDLQTMEKFTYATGTTGGGIAVRDLVERTNWMRKFRGANVYPIVTLTDVHMRTRFGGRQRPHFNIVRWVVFSDDGSVSAAPDSPQLAAPKTVTEPTLKEEMNDEINI